MNAFRFAKKHRLAMALLLAAFWQPAAAWAQEDAPRDTSEARQVEIITPSDSLVQTTEGGQRVQKLIGNVRLRQGTTLLSADRATRYRGRGEILFTGDVLIIDEGDSLWADRVRYDSREKIGRATGAVRVADGEVLLAGPAGRYFFREKHAVFPENVTLVDSARVLKSRGGEYFSRAERAEFYRQVRVFSDSTYLEADSVTYHRNTEVSEARGQVFIERRGDRASGERERRGGTEEGRLGARRDTAAQADTTGRMPRPSLLGRPLPVDTTRRALLPDTTARTLLWGQYAYNDPRGGYSRVSGRALLVRLQPPDSAEASSSADARPDSAAAPDAPDADSAAPPTAGRPDTLIVRARQLETTRSDTLRRLTATDSVRLWQQDLQAVADSAVYDQLPSAENGSADRRAEERARRRVSRFFGQPLAWSTDAQLSGDSLRVTGRGGAVRRLYARGNAFLAQEDSVLAGRLQQLKGRRMTGYFGRDSTGETTLRRLAAGPNAEVIFFRKEGSTLAGAVRTRSDTVIFHLQNGELQKIRMPSRTEGTSYEAENVPNPFRLEGLVWAPARRPQKAAFLTEGRVRRRLIRPEPEHPASEPTPADPPPATASGTSDG